MSFPTADQVALAIVTAARLQGDDPLVIAAGEHGPRGRHVAFAGLLEAFPEARKAGLARCVGYRSPGSASSNLRSAYRPAGWWNEDHVDEVVGALVADQYGEQGA